MFKRQKKKCDLKSFVNTVSNLLTFVKKSVERKFEFDQIISRFR